MRAWRFVTDNLTSFPHELDQRRSFAPGNFVPPDPRQIDVLLQKTHGIKVYPFPEDYIRPRNFDNPMQSNYPHHFGIKAVEVEVRSHDIVDDLRGVDGYWAVQTLHVLREIQIEPWMRTGNGNVRWTMEYLRQFPDTHDDITRAVVMGAGNNYSQVLDYALRYDPPGFDLDVFRLLLAGTLFERYVDAKIIDGETMVSFINTYCTPNVIGGFPVAIRCVGAPTPSPQIVRGF